jgi:type I restriction-modification system DNA methylase subunit
MAKKESKEKAIEVTLWDAANKLRGSVEPAEYKHVVLGLIFLKFARGTYLYIIRNGEALTPVINKVFIK